MLLLVSSVVAACSARKPPQVKADPNLIEMSVDATSTLVAADAPSTLAVRVRVAAARLPKGARPPLNLVLVLDTSGSMEGAAIEAARTAARDLVARMTARDQVSVVVFHSTAEILVPVTRLTDRGRAQVDAKLATIKARGTTAMAEGLQLGLTLAAQGRLAGGINRIVLLGDGVPNDASAFPALVMQARNQQVSVTTLGLGLEYDPTLLGTIALETGGVFRYIEEPEQVAAVFDHELTRLQQVIGRNLRLGLRPGPGVTLEAVPGVTNGRGYQSAFLGDLATGEVRDVIIPLSVTARRDGATVELLDIDLMYEDAVDGHGELQRSSFVAARSSSDAAAVAAAVKVDVEVARDRARAAGAILEAIALVRGGNMAMARAQLSTAETAAREAAARHDDDELRALADDMAELREHLAEVVSTAQATPAAGAGASAEIAAPRAPSPAPSSNEPVMSAPREAAIRRVHEHANSVLDQR